MCAKIVKYASTRFGIVKRSKGQSAIDHAAYISRSVIASEYDGQTYRPKYHEDLVHCEISLPENAPEEWRDRAALWNSVERNEKAKNAQLARTLKAALPNDWSYEVAEETVRDYVQRNFVSKGMCADWAIHDSVNPQGVHNLHFHLMLTMRPVGENGKWGAKQRKEYILDKDGNKIRNKSGKGFKSFAVDVNDWNDKGNSKKWRQDLTETINAVNDQVGVKEKWEHRSFKEMGIEQEPTVHLGAAASDLDRQGIRTEKGDINREITERNRILMEARRAYSRAAIAVRQLEHMAAELRRLKELSGEYVCRLAFVEVIRHNRKMELSEQDRETQEQRQAELPETVRKTARSGRDNGGKKTSVLQALHEQQAEIKKREEQKQRQRVPQAAEKRRGIVTMPHGIRRKEVFR